MTTLHYLKKRNDSTKFNYLLSLRTMDFIDRIEVWALRTDRPEEMPYKEYEELNSLWEHLSIYQFIRWMELKFQNLPADDPKYWDFRPEDIPYPFISYQKWSDELSILKKTIVDLRVSYKEKLKRNEAKYESRLLLLELQNEKLRKKINAFLKVKK